MGKTEALWNRLSVRINKEGRKERLHFQEMEKIGSPVRKRNCLPSSDLVNKQNKDSGMSSFI